LKRFGIILTILSLWVGCDEAEEAIEEELCVTESQALTAASEALDGTTKIDLPFSQHQAPHSWGFLFVG